MSAGERPEQEDDSPDALSQLISTSEGAVLHRCLAQLEPERRKLVVMAFADGLSHGELATRLSLPLGTVKCVDPAQSAHPSGVSRVMSEALDHDLLAAEYVLGSLDAERAQIAERLLAEDHAFESMVETWQRRLTPLAAMVAPAEPPADLWHRIAASTAKTESNVVPLRRLRFWQVCTAGALAVAASVIVPLSLFDSRYCQPSRY